MSFGQGLKMAWRGMLGNKLRTILTMLGIVIGVASVITLVAMGKGSARQVEEQMSSLGTNLLAVTITGRGVTSSLTVDEAMALGEIEGVAGVSPVVSGSVQAKNGTTNANVSIEGITPEYETVRNHHVRSGRFLLPIDIEYMQKVALIGSSTAEELFGAADPVGEYVTLNGIRYKIVGLLEEKGTSLGGSNDEKILIPISTAQRLLQSKGVRSIYLQAESREALSFVQTLVEYELASHFGGNTDSFRIFNQTETAETVASVSRTMSDTLAGIAAISLLVGGIGIMNIMLVSVAERTREIGVRKSVGAKRLDILMQFLLEALVISGWSGAFGIAASYGAVYWLNRSGTAAVITWDIVLLSFLFSFSIGIVFGLFPANKAARLKPVDALRYD